MKDLAIGFLFLGLALTACKKPRSGAIARPAGSKLDYFVVKPARQSFPLLLYLDGSSCRSVADVLGYFEPLSEMGFAALTFEKRGVRPGDTGLICSREYLDTNDRAQRVTDARLLLSKAKEILPGWNGQVVILGGSEGGTIAPEVAVDQPGVVGVASLAGGGLSQSEELDLAKESELTASHASPATVRSALAELRARFEEIRKDPTSSKTWLGHDNTYRRWASFLWYRPVDDFVRLDVPIYLAQGTRDTIESADAVRERFAGLHKSNLTYKRYEGLDHTWRDAAGRDQTERVIGELLEWVQQFR